MGKEQDPAELDRTASVQFHEMGLDDRILKAIAKLGWVEPSLIQEKAIPLFLDGKDVLMKARTGSGKTGAFAIPVIQKILSIKEVSPDEQKMRALILAPTKELCSQIFHTMIQLTAKCSRDVRTVDISAQMDVADQKPLLVDLPDVVVATPARALLHVKAGTLALKDLKMLVVDEADLMFSCGYESDVKKVISRLPKIYQAALASATLSDDVISLKKLILHNAVTLKLQESELAPLKQLTHYKYYCEPKDKCAVLYTLLKLGLIQGKSIIFVNTVDKCYRLKLFLEQFKISSCILNSELPAASRCHAVAQFNQGTYDIIIASDESFLDDPSKESKRNKDREFGVSRGIDFQFVSNIINYDFPMSINSYIHRAGRTARGSNQGTVLSFISVTEVAYMEGVDDYLKESLGSSESIFKLYTFKMNEMEGFIYRARDAWKACTKAVVREVRLKEIKQEVLNSKKLKGYFEENPKDLNTLRHDKKLKAPKTGQHMANVPDYLVPKSLKGVSGLVKIKKVKRKFKPTNTTNRKYEAKLKNPLNSMDLTEFDDVINAKKRKT